MNYEMKQTSWGSPYKNIVKGYSATGKKYKVYEHLRLNDDRIGSESFSEINQ